MQPRVALGAMPVHCGSWQARQAAPTVCSCACDPSREAPASLCVCYQACLLKLWKVPNEINMQYHVTLEQGSRDEGAGPNRQVAQAL